MGHPENRRDESMQHASQVTTVAVWSLSDTAPGIRQTCFTLITIAANKKEMLGKKKKAIQVGVLLTSADEISTEAVSEVVEHAVAMFLERKRRN